MKGEGRWWLVFGRLVHPHRIGGIARTLTWGSWPCKLCSCGIMGGLRSQPMVATNFSNNIEYKWIQYTFFFFSAIIIFSLSLLPIYALHINLESLLLLMGQHPETSKWVNFNDFYFGYHVRCKQSRWKAFGPVSTGEVIFKKNIDCYVFYGIWTFCQEVLQKFEDTDVVQEDVR